jgi:UDP-glucose 4-epimerase
MNYSGKRALVTGGLGFIGSNLALRLLDLGAEVVVMDSAVAGCGANEANLADAGGRIEILRDDIRHAARYRSRLERLDVVFNLAGEISHINSMRDPLRDLDLNATAQLEFVLALREFCPGIRIVYAGTRQIYGAPKFLPIPESHPIQPIDFNGVHNYAAECYHRLLTGIGELHATVLRLTNVYGPRMALNIPQQGVLGHFFRRALLGDDLEVYGDGRQLRDPVYVDDIVDAFLCAAAEDKPRHEVYNAGGLVAIPMLEIAREIARGGGGELRMRAFPEGHKAIDIGSYATDWSLLQSDTGWAPRTTLSEGVEKTLAWFRPRAGSYLDPADAVRAAAREGEIHRT